MARIYPRGGYWWIEFRDPSKPLVYLKTGRTKPVRENTGFRTDNKPETAKANELRLRRSLAELQASGIKSEERWAAWVVPFLESEYQHSPKTLLRYKNAWRMLEMFLTDKSVELPRQLVYNHCEDYFKWRAVPDPARAKYAAIVNTAIEEMKILAIIMKQAVRKGMAQGNPCRELRMRRIKARRFPKYKPVHIQMIVDAIRTEPKDKQAFLWPSFLLAWYHCVRLNETNVNPAKCVRLSEDGTNDVIIFHQKGGKVRMKPLHPELRDFFRHRRTHQQLFKLPKSFAKEWHNFLHRSGVKALLPAACFHSLRVTGNNRLRAAGIAKEIRKAYLSHDHREDVNAGYNRIEGDEDVDPDDFDTEDVDLDELRQCHAPMNKCWE